MPDNPAHQEPNRKPLLSIVVPVFDEGEVIELTHKRIVDVLGGRSEFDLEIVYVDDGSKDQSPVLLGNIAKADRRVCVVFFREISVTRRQSPRGFGRRRATSWP